MRTRVRWSVEDPVVADVLGEHGHRKRTYRRGRICAMPGCETHLSIYNSREMCAEHDFAADLRPTVRRRTVRSGRQG